MTKPKQAKTEYIGTRMIDIPYEALRAIGMVFREGEAKYGRANWKDGGTAYLEERCDHAIRHLMLWANGDRSEPHLAKVAFFCCIQIWHDSRRSK